MSVCLSTRLLKQQDGNELCKASYYSDICLYIYICLRLVRISLYGLTSLSLCSSKATSGVLGIGSVLVCMLPLCLLACLVVWLFASLLVCLLASVLACLFSCLLACWFACLLYMQPLIASGQIIGTNGPDVSVRIRLLSGETLLRAKNSTGRRWDLNPGPYRQYSHCCKHSKPFRHLVCNMVATMGGLFDNLPTLIQFIFWLKTNVIGF